MCLFVWFICLCVLLLLFLVRACVRVFCFVCFDLILLLFAVSDCM